MKTINFKQEAVAFVIKHGCVNSTPAELIQQAMEQGAAMIIEKVNERLKESVVDLEKKRAAGKMHDYQPKPIELPNY